MIDKYKIVSARSSADLEVCVNHHITSGWQPYGPMHVDNGKVQMTFYQAMVYYATP